ncbi:unnamed protein product [Lactuca virosa]|uniref:RRM domain-containing protein n=1 Tax=Lactuca virosa TaxID=75947 RepID=A0AAU9MLM0_9ASTR|nr:unnamed protein product [Lactuca virosa]
MGGLRSVVRETQEITLRRSLAFTSQTFRQTVAMVRKTFQTFGKLVVVYIFGRKDKGGSFFAFIRYEGVKDIDSLVLTLNQVRCGHCIAKVNIAKYVKKPPRLIPPPRSNRTSQPVIPSTKWNNICNGKSFVEVVSGNHRKYDTTPHSPSVEILMVLLKRAPMLDSCNSRCLIGEVKDLKLLNNMHTLLNVDESIATRVLYAGG